MKKEHCYYCGNGYYQNRSDQLYCSKKCRLANYAEIQKCLRQDENKRWVIQRKNKIYGLGGGYDISYYIGKTYQFKGEVYAEFINWYHRSEAKLYSSKKRAENAMSKLKEKVGNWDSLEVVQFPKKDQ